MNGQKPNGHRRLLSAVLCVAVGLVWIVMVFTDANAGETLHEFLKAHYAETLALFPTVTLLALLFFVVAVDSYVRPMHKRILFMIVAAVFSLTLQNYLEYLLMRGELRWLARTLVAIYGYVVRPMIIAMFLRLVRPKDSLIFAKALVGVNAAVHVTALFSDICFRIVPPNTYHRGPLGQLCFYISAILLLWLLYVTIRDFEPRRRIESWIPVLVLLLIVGALVLDGNVGSIDQPVSYLTLASAVCCVAYYIWLHLQMVREHERELVAGQRLQMALSQIKPHFLYNALGVIEELCDSDPVSAKEATVKFSQYLRGNMVSIANEGLIPFSQELEHTRLYLELEQLRFEGALSVRYDIACENFALPPLTLEPLAENAVRHGVRGNADGRGTVAISTRQCGDHFEIAVRDDGPGFDLAAVIDDGKAHIGLENVRNRIQRMCRGTVKIDSEPGRGTTVTIELPLETTDQRWEV